MRISTRLAFCFIVGCRLLFLENAFAVTSNTSLAIPNILQKITILADAVPDKGARIKLLGELATIQARASQLKNSNETYLRWIKEMDSHGPRKKIGMYDYDNILLENVRLLSNIGAAAIYADSKTWGMNRIQEAIRLVEVDPKPWNRVAGYRTMVETQYSLGISADAVLRKVQWELKNLKLNVREPDEQFPRDRMLLDILEIEFMVNGSAGAERVLETAYQVINDSKKGTGIFLLRKIAVFQTKIAKFEQAMDNIIRVYRLRKAGGKNAYQEWEPEARYITDICALVQAQMKINREKRARETFDLAKVKIHSFPNKLPIFQFAWRSIATTAALLGEAPVRKEAEKHIQNPYFKNFSAPELVRRLVREKNVEEATRLAVDNKSLLPVLVEELFRKKNFSEIMKIRQYSNDCENLNCFKIFGNVIASQQGPRVADFWVNQQSSTLAKAYSLLGILIWFLGGIDLQLPA